MADAGDTEIKQRIPLAIWVWFGLSCLAVPGGIVLAVVGLAVGSNEWGLGFVLSGLGVVFAMCAQHASRDPRWDKCEENEAAASQLPWNNPDSEWLPLSLSDD